MTKRLTDEELAEIRERAEKATAGKWRVDYGVTAYDRTVTTESFEILCENVSPKDAEFIAHAREDIPKLLAEIERLKSEYDHLKIHIENSEATCEICGDYFMPNVDSEETLYYCGNCREEN